MTPVSRKLYLLAVILISSEILIEYANSGGMNHPRRFVHRGNRNRPPTRNRQNRQKSQLGRFVIRNGPETKVHLSDADFRRARDRPVADQPMSTNVIVQKDMIEGDISGHTPDSFKEFVGHVNDFEKKQSDPSVQSSAILDPLQRWPEGKIPYVISSYYSPEARAKIAEAFADFQSRTCVRFIPRYYEDDYIYVRPQGGCWSNVGKAGGEQTVSLADGCFQKGTVLHEFLHAMGFFHEQSRNDRDYYVSVHWENISPGAQGNFAKYPLYMIDHLQTHYDYKSVMHYGKTFFSYNGKGIFHKLRNEIGQRRGFSDIDVERVNKLYKCSNQPQPYRPRPRPAPRPSPAPYTYPPPRPRPPPQPSYHLCDGCRGCTGCAGCAGCDGCPGCPGCAPCRSVNGQCPQCPSCPQCHQCPYRGCQTCPACPRCPC